MIKWITIEEKPLICKSTIYQNYPVVGYDIFVEQKENLFVLSIKDDTDKEIYKDAAGSLSGCEDLCQDFISKTQKKHTNSLETHKDLLEEFISAFEKSTMFNNIKDKIENKVKQNSDQNRSSITYFLKKEDEEVSTLISLTYGYNYRDLVVQVSLESFYTNAHYQDKRSGSERFSINLHKTPKDPIEQCKDFLKEIESVKTNTNTGLGHNY